MRRALGWSVVAGAALVVAAPGAAVQEGPPPTAAPLRVVAVPGLGTRALEGLAARGAVGLVVPGAGPTTSERAALAAIASGEVRNSLRGEAASGRRLVRVEVAHRVPAGQRLVVVGIPAGGRQRNDRRYPVAVVAPGYAGLLTSRSTRIPGLVSAADIAPTALGRPGRLGTQPSGDPVEELARLDRRIRDNGTARPAAMAIACAAVILLAWRRPAAALPALLAALVANLGLGLAGTSRLVVVVAASAASVLVVAVPRWRRWPTATASTAVVAAYGAALALAPAAVALSPLGPTQNSRFYGLSNLLETALVVPLVAAAAGAARRAGWAGLAAVAAVAVPVFTLSRLGADGGGAAVLAVALPVAAVEACRAPRRALALAVPAAALVAVAVVRLDAASGATSHLTRALGGGVVDELAQRVALSATRLAAGWHVAAITAAAAAALVVAHRSVVRHLPDRAARAAPTAVAAAVAASLVVNDSPPEVAVLGVVGYLALAAPARARGQAAGRSSSDRASPDQETAALRRNGPGRSATTSVVPPAPGATHTGPAATHQGV